MTTFDETCITKPIKEGIPEKVPFNWGVEYLHYGEKRKFISLDKSSAEAYAARHNGVVFPVFK